MARVYIETTIPSYYFETRRAVSVRAWHEATRRWWDRHAAAYDLVTSRVTLDELDRTPEPKRSLALGLVKSIPLVEPRAGVEEIAQFYVDHRLVPADSFTDAMHIALASVHGVEFLATWNCRHLANANKARHLAVLNARLGLAVPIITTPLTLMPEQNDAHEGPTKRID